LNLCVFASGRGSNLQAILKARQKNKIKSEVKLIISNNSTAYALQTAIQNNIPGLHISLKQFKNEKEYTSKLLDILKKYNIELIILAGYMKLIPAEIIKKFKNRIINIHPALIPAFSGHGLYGIRVHEAAIEYGVKFSGVTVHLVDEIYDNGPIVLQKPVKVIDSDDAETLQKRILKYEHKILPDAIKLFESKKFNIKGRRVFFT
jgi:phosphoribosylglycinamide formyltransferase-1